MRHPRNRKNESPVNSRKGHDTQPAEQLVEDQAASEAVDPRTKPGKGRSKPPRGSTESSSTTSTTSTLQEVKNGNQEEPNKPGTSLMLTPQEPCAIALNPDEPMTVEQFMEKVTTADQAAAIIRFGLEQAIQSIRRGAVWYWHVGGWFESVHNQKEIYGGHGHWEEFCQEKCGLHPKTAWEYRTFYRERTLDEAKSYDGVRFNLAKAISLDVPEEPPEEEEPVEWVGGDTLQETFASVQEAKDYWETFCKQYPESPSEPTSANSMPNTDNDQVLTGFALYIVDDWNGNKETRGWHPSLEQAKSAASHIADGLTWTYDEGNKCYYADTERYAFYIYPGEPEEPALTGDDGGQRDATSTTPEANKPPTPQEQHRAKRKAKGHARRGQNKESNHRKGYDWETSVIVTVPGTFEISIGKSKTYFTKKSFNNLRKQMEEAWERNERATKKCKIKKLPK